MKTYEPRKRILVTGGVGFLGSHLVGRLLEGGDEVLCAENPFTGLQQEIEAYRGGRTPQGGLHGGTGKTIDCFEMLLSAGV